MIEDEVSGDTIGPRNLSQPRRVTRTIGHIQEPTSQPVLGERMLEARSLSKSFQIANPPAGT